MIQAQEYSDYWNTRRPHSGKGMNGKTPEEKLQSLGVINSKRILDYKVFNLDASFYLLQEHLEYFLFQQVLRKTTKEKLLSDRKV